MSKRWCHPFTVLTLFASLCVPLLSAQDGASESKKAADARQQLYTVDYRNFRNLDDYLSRCNQVRAIIPSLESFYQWSDGELERLRIKHSDNPKLLELADFYVALNAQDKAGLKVLRHEMELADQMSKLPPEKRHGFFTEQILPVQKKEDQLSKREVEMARDAEKRGLPLPSWLSTSLGNSR
jgi:hypothetical protein